MSPKRSLVQRVDALPEPVLAALLLSVIALLVVLFVSFAGGDDHSDARDEPSMLACPAALEVLADRVGGGFVRGVDPEYDVRMDWDGDGVSCE